jgi:hypothetical protein
LKLREVVDWSRVRELLNTVPGPGETIASMDPSPPTETVLDAFVARDEATGASKATRSAARATMWGRRS